MLNSNEIARAVSVYPVLAELPPALQHAFMNASTPLQAEWNTALFDLSTPAQSFVMVTSGTIRVTRQCNGREIVLYRVQPGEYCILTVCNVINATLFETTSFAETEISGVAIPATVFKRMIDESPIFNISIFRSFASRLSELLDLIDGITFMQLDKRLAGLLLSKGSAVKLTHSQLADELGSVREVISRILKDFEIKGLVKLDRNQVRIIDQEALGKIARLV